MIGVEGNVHEMLESYMCPNRDLYEIVLLHVHYRDAVVFKVLLAPQAAAKGERSTALPRSTGSVVDEETLYCRI